MVDLLREELLHKYHLEKQSIKGRKTQITKSELYPALIDKLLDMVSFQKAICHPLDMEQILLQRQQLFVTSLQSEKVPPFLNLQRAEM